MARLNLTIPDPLYERLEQLRDRVNVSKVCAVALTKELDMIESTAMPGSDSKVQRLIQRFLRQREVQELWYRRGQQDGETWAIERASLEELRMLAEDIDEDSLQDIESWDEIDDLIDPDEFPSVNIKKRLVEWQRTDRLETGQEILDADWKAYLRGWWLAAHDLWQAAKPALQ